MLWREKYETRYATEVDLPVPAGTNLVGDWTELNLGDWVIGLFGYHDVSSMGVWQRLMDSAGVEPVILLLKGSEPLPPPSELRAIFPLSQHPRVLISAQYVDFADVLKPGRHEACFAFVVGLPCPVAMLGKPTEDAWEAFLAVARPTPTIPPASAGDLPKAKPSTPARRLPGRG
jgi:hypothetical protein